MEAFIADELRLYKSNKNNEKGQPSDIGNEEFTYTDQDFFFEESNEEDTFEGEPEEEQNEFDDSELIESIFETLERTFVLNDLDTDKLIQYTRRLEYDYKAIATNLKNGVFGPVVRSKTSNNNQKKIAPKVHEPRIVLTSKDIEAMESPTRTTVEDVRAHIQSNKSMINLAIIGHVDAGKSTTIGHILYICKAIKETEMSKIKRDIQHSSSKDEKFAWVMYNNPSEREHGVTIDVSEKNFETEKLIVKFFDTPGHKDYVPSMITGASVADAAILLIDAAKPALLNGQFTEHILICRSLGINKFIVVINKMDRVEYSEERFNEVKTEVSDFLSKVGITDTLFLPGSAITGDGLVAYSENLSWFYGPTLYDSINDLNPPKRQIEDDFQLSIFDSFNGGNNKWTIVGRINGGYVCENDVVMAVPIQKLYKVDFIEVNGERVPFAYAGQYASVTLKSSDPADTLLNLLELTSIRTQRYVGVRFTAIVNTFEMKAVLTKGSKVLYHKNSINTPVTVLKVDYWLDKVHIQPIKVNPQYVPSNSCAIVTFEFQEPFSMVPNSQSKFLSRFILRNAGKTIGFGSVVKPLS